MRQCISLNHVNKLPMIRVLYSRDFKVTKTIKVYYCMYSLRLIIGFKISQKLTILAIIKSNFKTKQFKKLHTFIRVYT